MADLTCPECGTVADVPAIRRAAEEFCRHCDYPLFWTPSAVPAAVGGPTADATLRRLPGAGGRQRIGSKVCPECGELNPLGTTHCLRCTADLDPAPAPPPVVAAPLPPPAPTPVVVPEPATPWWWWLILALVLTAGTIALIVVL